LTLDITWVLVEEVKSGDWGIIAGNPLSTADVKALAAGSPVGWAGPPARRARRRGLSTGALSGPGPSMGGWRRHLRRPTGSGGSQL
jgi:hypothetical protein